MKKDRERMSQIFSFILVLSTWLFVVESAGKLRTDPWMRKESTNEERADTLISAMTLPEKIGMLHGVPNSFNGDVIYVGLVPANERLGIPALRLNDGYVDFVFQRIVP